MTDKQYINNWSDIVKEYLPKWDETLPISLRSRDIEKDITNLVEWLKTHENKPELTNFRYSILPYRFVHFLNKYEIY